MNSYTLQLNFNLTEEDSRYKPIDSMNNHFRIAFQTGIGPTLFFHD